MRTESRDDDGAYAGGVIGRFDVACAKVAMAVAGSSQDRGLAGVASKHGRRVAGADEPGVPSPRLSFVLP